MYSVHLLKIMVAALCAMFVGAGLRAEEAAEPSIESARDALHRKYVLLLNKRADALAAEGQATAAKRVRAWPISQQPNRNYLHLPLSDGDHRSSDGNHRPEALNGDDELRNLQQFYARRLMQLATRANDEDRRALAYQVAHQALRADPQNKSARAVVNAGKRQPFRQKRTSQGWEIETEHFEITTTDTPETAEEVGRRLEELHAIWRQLFADYWFTKAELDRRFAGGRSRVVEPNHKVMLFANKQQYVDYLKRDEPGIEVSLGYYAERPRTAYFYADDATLATQFHEATHQLFHERQRRGRAAGINNNFWVVEGIATYMESLQKGDGYFVVGGPAAYRLQFARYRALTEEFYVPLGKLVAMGRDDMKSAGENLPRLYSQSAGLAHFFMDAGGGKYRDAFVQYLDAVYRDRDDAATLSRLVGKRYEALDAEYLEYLRVADDDLAAIIPGENAARLYLGRTKITDAALPSIAALHGLQRLDVGYCRITDDGLTKLPAGETLVQLNLEHTQVTDKALPHIARFSSLRELDLSGCRISDEGLKAISRMPNLEVLWLTGTPVSDAGMEHLQGLKNLKFLDTGGSRVTANGWATLKRAVPSVSDEQ